jgi:hypothetical protein
VADQQPENSGSLAAARRASVARNAASSEIDGVEPFGEPPIDRFEKLAGFVAPPSIAQQASEARSGAQLEAARALLPRHCKCRVKGGFDFLPIRAWPLAQQVAAKPVELRIIPSRARSLRRCQGLGEHSQPLLDLTCQRESLCRQAEKDQFLATTLPYR